MNKIQQIIIALGLTLALFQALRICGYSSGLDDGNNYGPYMFTSSFPNINSTRTPANWESRKATTELCAIWGEYFGYPLQKCSGQENATSRAVVWEIAGQREFSDCYAGWYAFWFLLLCAVLVWQLDNALLPMAGAFISILGCTPPRIVPYMLPWDLPTMVFFTACCLIYLQPRFKFSHFVLAGTILAGSLIKETVLVCSLFFWAMPKLGKWRYFMPLILFALSHALNYFICRSQPDWAYSLKLFNPADFWKLYPVLLANGGTLILLPWLLYQRKDTGLNYVLGTFIVLQALNDMTSAVYDENRDWLEIAPITWYLLGTLMGKKNIPVPVKATAKTSK
jgi:hypothetical protein